MCKVRPCLSGEYSGYGKEQGAGYIYGAFHCIGNRAGYSRENERHKTCAVRLMLAHLHDAHHEGNHNHSAAKTYQSAENPCNETD